MQQTHNSDFFYVIVVYLVYLDYTEIDKMLVLQNMVINITQKNEKVFLDSIESDYED